MSDEIQAAEEEMQSPTEKQLFGKVKGILGSLKGSGKRGVDAAKTIGHITKAVAYSMDAKKICEEIDIGKKDIGSYRRAAELTKRGLNLIDGAEHDFPQTAGALLETKSKLLAQYDQICQVALDEHGIDIRQEGNKNGNP